MKRTLGMVLIQYIGSQPKKEDNVRDSGRVWDRPGAVLEIPEGEKHFYLRANFASIWREVNEDQLQHEQEVAKVGLGDIKQALDTLGSDELAEVETMVKLRISQLGEMRAAAMQEEADQRADRERLASLSGSVPLVPTGAAAGATNDANAMQAAASRSDKIKLAVKHLDPDSLEDYTKGGTPRVDRVAQVAGLADVTGAEITDAMS